MPHRVGFLWEKMVSESNCIAAELEMARNKKHNPVAVRIRNNPEKYGKTLCSKIEDYHFHAYREVDITDSYKGKTRHLKIPTMEDQAAMQAWLIVATPYIEARNYYYNCGSIPKAGQTRCVKVLQKWLKKKPKWGGTTDIRKFYDTCPHWVVMRGLRRIFKDERFLSFAERMLEAMSNNGVGLAIGFPISHWFANVALMQIDHELKRKYPDVNFTRYMDDMAFSANRKRHIRYAYRTLAVDLHTFGMEIKKNWQIYPIKKRGISFLSYRFYHGYTILNKGLMYRISRKMRRAAKNRSVHMMQGVVSYLGILKHCNSYNFRVKHVYPYIKPKNARRIVSNGTKKRNLRQPS